MDTLGLSSDAPLPTETERSERPTLRLSLGAKLGIAVAVIIPFAFPFLPLNGERGPEASDVYIGIAVASALAMVFAAPAILRYLAYTRELAAYNEAQLQTRLARIVDFNATQELRLVHDVLTRPLVGGREPAIFIDGDRKKVALIKHLPDFDPRVFGFKDLLGVEVVENDVTVVVTKTSRSSQLGGALMGGVLFGGVGAMVGGLSGKKVSTSRGRIKAVQLRVLVNDTVQPLFTVDFLGTEVAENDIRYRKASEQAHHWHDVIKVLIHRADAEAEPVPAPATAQSNVSIADELRKLADLKTSGILTDEEFNAQKRALLASSTR